MPTLRVVTYNVQRMTRPDGANAVDAIAAALSKLAPDIVGLNEVDIRKRPGSLEALAEALGREQQRSFHVHFFGHVRGSYGNAVLSRWPIVAGSEASVHLRGGVELSFPAGTKLYNGAVAGADGVKHRIVRGVAGCAVDVGSGRRVFVASAHLDHMSEDQRRVQLDHLVGEVLPAEVPVLLMGDLNALQRCDYTDAEWSVLETRARDRDWNPPKSGCLDALSSAGFVDCFRHKHGDVVSVPIAERMTAHVDHPAYRIDYCWANPDFLQKWAVTDAFVARGVRSSDHYPLVVQFEAAGAQEDGAKL